MCNQTEVDTKQLIEIHFYKILLSYDKRNNISITWQQLDFRFELLTTAF